MSERIYKALSDDFIRRMRNWVMAEAGALGMSSLTLDLGCTRDGYRESTMPILCGEAQDTIEGLRKLPIRYRQAVEQFWRYEGRSLRAHARRRQVHYSTFEAWVMRGHDLLRDVLRRKARALANKRAGYEELRIGH